MPANVAEEIVRQVLVRMQAAGSILGFLINNKDDRLDKEGIDFLIFLQNGLAVPLQVKTYSRKKYHSSDLAEHLRKHPMVLFFLTVDIHKIRSSVFRYVEDEIRKMVRRAMSKPPFRAS